MTGFLGAALSGCVVPLPYPDVEVDAAQSGYPPVIRSSTPRMGDKTIQIFKSEDPAPTFTIDVEDRDLEDTIYVRVFRDYDPATPTNSVTNRQFPPGGTALRTLELSTASWCTNAISGELSVFEVIAADRPFDDETPGFRTVTPPGDFSIRPWIATCEE